VPGLSETLEDLRHVGHEDRLFVRDFRVALAEQNDSAGSELSADGLLEEPLQAPADHPPDPFERERRDTQSLHRETERVGDSGVAVDEGAVQVEDDEHDQLSAVSYQLSARGPRSRPASLSTAPSIPSRSSNRNVGTESPAGESETRASAPAISGREIPARVTSTRGIETDL